MNLATAVDCPALLAAAREPGLSPIIAVSLIRVLISLMVLDL